MVSALTKVCSVLLLLAVSGCASMACAPGESSQACLVKADRADRVARCERRAGMLSLKASVGRMCPNAADDNGEDNQRGEHAIITSINCPNYATGAGCY